MADYRTVEIAMKDDDGEDYVLDVEVNMDTYDPRTMSTSDPTIVTPFGDQYPEFEVLTTHKVRSQRFEDGKETEYHDPVEFCPFDDNQVGDALMDHFNGD